MHKAIAVLLCFVLAFAICGCGASVQFYAETEAETEIREGLEANLRNLYAGPTSYMFEKCLEPLESITEKELQESMNPLLGSNVKFIATETLFAQGEFTVYCVALVLDYITGEREVYHDLLITRNSDGKQLVVLQMNLDEETQKTLMATRDENKALCEQLFESSMDSFCEESKPFKSWWGNRKETLKINSTPMSMLSEVKIAETVYTRGGRTLVWSEEFENVTSLSETKMAYYRTMNNDSLKITKDDSNLSFKDGTMTMHARPAGGEYHYSIPDGITTYGTMAYKGGYLEMRAKVPFEHGAWPSFWEKSYPGLYETNYGAEIDIFEVFSSETSLACNLHKWGEEHIAGGIGDSKTFAFASNEEATDWHTYGFEWTETQYRFYIDGVCYCSLYVDEEHDFAPEVEGMGGFQDYHYVILNCFIFNNKSSWAPEGSQLADNETKEITYTVDYIRLYQNKETDKIIIYK